MANESKEMSVYIGGEYLSSLLVWWGVSEPTWFMDVEGLYFSDK